MSPEHDENDYEQLSEYGGQGEGGGGSSNESSTMAHRPDLPAPDYNAELHDVNMVRMTAETIATSVAFHIRHSGKLVPHVKFFKINYAIHTLCEVILKSWDVSTELNDKKLAFKYTHENFDSL